MDNQVQNAPLPVANPNAIKQQPQPVQAPVQNTASSYDANNNVLVSTMCGAMRLVTGNAGKAFAAFAIISLGIGFFTGKVSWGLMIGVAMGIAAMFGAPTIVSALTGKDSFDCGG